MKTIYTILLIIITNMCFAVNPKDTSKLSYHIKENLYVTRCIQSYTEDKDAYCLHETMLDSVFVLWDESYYKVEKGNAAIMLSGLRREFIMYGYSIQYSEEDNSYLLSYKSAKMDKMLTLHIEFYIHENAIYALKIW